MVFSPCIKFRANICHSGRDIAIKPIFKNGGRRYLEFSSVAIFGKQTYLDSVSLCPCKIL